MGAMHEALRHTAGGTRDLPQPFTPMVTIDDPRDHGKIGRTSSRDSSGSGTMVRTGSNRSAGSGRSRGSSPELALSHSQRELSALETRLSETERELAAARKSGHLVESFIDPRDLTVTWEDRDKGFTDWRQCLVSGAHLGESWGHFTGEYWYGYGAGAVVRAMWKTSIKVAIKRNLNPNADNEDEMKLFVDLHHPHVVACYGLLNEEREGRPVTSIVTERCTTSLEAFLDDHDKWKDKTDDELDMTKYTILLHVSLGLQKLHDMNVLHRDIKSNNILLDGAAGTCPTCDHSGNWKICDFGEAKVLKAPTLHFAKPQKWPKGWGDSLIRDGRFQPIASPFLREQGARHYCWLLPGEELRAAGDCEEPPLAAEAEGLERSQKDRWVPCRHGGFVYSFSDDVTQHSEYDCFFDISATAGFTYEDAIFPTTLGPFGLSPTELKPQLNFDDNTYRLRRITHANPQLELLKSFGVKLKGKFSPVSEVTLTAEARRHLMIPQDATHFAWAYQAVDLEMLTQEQSSQLETDSGEISFVSLGGFVYMRDVEFKEDGQTVFDAEVIATNAIALGLGVSCRHGTIDRHTCGRDNCDPDTLHYCDDGQVCDNGVTAAVASPELLDGQAIGLETDIYAFGIVMWEVITRRRAWHWFTGAEKDTTIATQAGVFNRRPKMPEGLTVQCARRLRGCLHVNPGRRPTAKELTVWVTKCRQALQDSMTAAAKTKITGAQLEEGDYSFMSRRSRTIVDRPTNDHWSKRGRYSLHKSTNVPGSFTLETVECTQDEWMENALAGDEKQPKPLGRLARMPKSKFGLDFKIPDGHGGHETKWPMVTAVDAKGNTIAAEFPAIQPGCTLRTINGQKVDDHFPTFKSAVKELKKLPLKLEFTSAVAEAQEAVPPWIRAGLLEIGLVHKHEIARHKAQVAAYGDSPLYHPVHHDPKEGLERVHSPSWRGEFELEPKDAGPEPEPEPEPELGPELSELDFDSIDREQAVATMREQAELFKQMRGLVEQTQREDALLKREIAFLRTGSASALTAGMEGIDLVRAHEDRGPGPEVEEGKPPTPEKSQKPSPGRRVAKKQPEPEPELSVLVAHKEKMAVVCAVDGFGDKLLSTTEPSTQSTKRSGSLRGYLRKSSDVLDESYDFDNWVEHGDEVQIIRLEGAFAWVRETTRGHEGFLRDAYLQRDAVALFKQMSELVEEAQTKTASLERENASLQQQIQEQADALADAEEKMESPWFHAGIEASGMVRRHEHVRPATEAEEDEGGVEWRLQEDNFRNAQHNLSPEERHPVRGTALEPQRKQQLAEQYLLDAAKKGHVKYAQDLLNHYSDELARSLRPWVQVAPSLQQLLHEYHILIGSSALVHQVGSSSRFKIDARLFFRRLGCFLDHYRLDVEASYESPTCKVYCATDVGNGPDSSTDTRAAVKIITGEGAMEHFDRELRARAGLLDGRLPIDDEITVRAKETIISEGHPREDLEEWRSVSKIPVRTHRDCDEGSFIVVMELASDNLATFMLKNQTKAGLDIDWVRKNFREMVSALKQVHAADVVHRDVKPRNLCRLQGSQWKLIDYDASVKAAPGNGDFSKSSSAYAPPELARQLFCSCAPGTCPCDRKETGDPRTGKCASASEPDKQSCSDKKFDVWSLGQVLYELCCGHSLFMRNSANDKLVDVRDKCALCVWDTISDAQLEPVFRFSEGSDTEAAQAAKDLIRWCLQGVPNKRPDVAEIESHQFLAQEHDEELSLIAMSVPKRVSFEQYDMRYHAFLSHAQADASGTASTLHFAFQRLGVNTWLDMYQKDVTLDGMLAGVRASAVFILVLSKRVLAQWFCHQEIQAAIKLKKPIIIVLEEDQRFFPFDVVAWKASAEGGDPAQDRLAPATSPGTHDIARGPDEKGDDVRKVRSVAGAMKAVPADICEAVDKHLPMAVTYRRRNFEADAMMRELCSERRMGTKLVAPDPNPALNPREKPRRVLAIYNTDADSKYGRLAAKMFDILERELDKRVIQLVNSGDEAIDAAEELRTVDHVLLLLTAGVLRNDKSRSRELLEAAVDMNKKNQQHFDFMTAVHSEEAGWEFQGEEHTARENSEAVTEWLDDHESITWRRPCWLHERSAMDRSVDERPLVSTEEELEVERNGLQSKMVSDLETRAVKEGVMPFHMRIAKNADSKEEEKRQLIDLIMLQLQWKTRNSHEFPAMRDHLIQQIVKHSEVREKVKMVEPEPADEGVPPDPSTPIQEASPAERRAERHAELSSLKLSTLQERAEAQGVDAEKLEDAYDDDDPEAAVIKLIFEHEDAEKEAAAEAARLEQLESELQGMKLKGLRQRAQQEGVGKEELRDACDQGTRAIKEAAVIALIMQQARGLTEKPQPQPEPEPESDR
eukprot:COSAG04_NODE_24_length_37684_cov_50.391060_11_plen_2361_part_00